MKELPTSNKPVMTVEIFDCNLSPNNFLEIVRRQIAVKDLDSQISRSRVSSEYWILHSRNSFFRSSSCPMGRTPSRQFTDTIAVIFGKDCNLRYISHGAFPETAHLTHSWCNEESHMSSIDEETYKWLLGILVK